MKYGDELDRIPADGVSRRQFLAVGRLHAARLAAGLMLPGGRKHLTDTPTDTAHDTEEPSATDNR
jgi:hypothetical protein